MISFARDEHTSGHWSLCVGQRTTNNKTHRDCGREIAKEGLKEKEREKGVRDETETEREARERHRIPFGRRKTQNERGVFDDTCIYSLSLFTLSGFRAGLTSRGIQSIEHLKKKQT